MDATKPPRPNPLKLNPLQLRSLTLFQEIARYPELATLGPNGEALLSQIPQPHGNHFHIGGKVVAAADATGLRNQAVWVALERKGLVRTAAFPHAIVLTPAGLAYETGLAGKIFHGSDH
jgi:hypothetical protein